MKTGPVVQSLSPNKGYHAEGWCMHYSALYLVPAIAISPLAPGEFKKQLLTTPSKPRSVGKFFDLLKQTLPEISLPPLSRFSPQAAAPSPLLCRLSPRLDSILYSQTMHCAQQSPPAGICRAVAYTQHVFLLQLCYVFLYLLPSQCLLAEALLF